MGATAVTVLMAIVSLVATVTPRGTPLRLAEPEHSSDTLSQAGCSTLPTSMAAPLHVDMYRVEHGDGYSVPCITIPNRRAAGNPVLRFLFQRDVECVLWGHTTSGPIYKVLNASGLDSTALQVSKANVKAGLLLQAEFDQVLSLFRSTMPADIVDPCSLGRIRTCTLLPFSTAAAVARTFGRSGGSSHLRRGDCTVL